MSAELARHIDQPATRHRLVLLDTRRLRCLDCTQTVLLTQPAGSTSTSSRSPIPGPGDPRCRQHPTQHADNCRTCAADAKAATDVDLGGRHGLEHAPTADVPARASEARAVLRVAIPHSVVGDVPPSTLDVVRMAQARAELDAMRQESTDAHG